MPRPIIKENLDTNYYHVIELNKLGDNVTIKTFPTKERAEDFARVMAAYADEGEEYYIEDIRTQW